MSGTENSIIQQQILSRTRLERIIQEFNLYPDERKRMIMEDVIEPESRRWLWDLERNVGQGS